MSIALEWILDRCSTYQIWPEAAFAWPLTGNDKDVWRRRWGGATTSVEIHVHVSSQDSADDDRLYIWNYADERTQEEDLAGEESEITQSPPENLSAQVRDDAHMLSQLRVK